MHGNIDITELGTYSTHTINMVPSISGEVDPRRTECDGVEQELSTNNNTTNPL